jgi:hypothetical protein
MDHHHEGCPHDHEGDVCPLAVAETGVASEVDVEAVQIAADAAVDIAEIEAATELAQIDASLEHHRLDFDLAEDANDTSIEHHQIEASADDELEEQVADLEEVLEELEEVLEEEPAEESIGEEPSEDEPAGDSPTSILPPPRVEASTPAKARHQSAFSRRHSR